MSFKLPIGLKRDQVPDLGADLLRHLIKLLQLTGFWTFAERRKHFY